MKFNLNRSVVSLPDVFALSIAELPSWIQYFTMSNNQNQNEIQEYTIVIPNGFTNEVLGEFDDEALDFYTSFSKFTGKRIYDCLRSNAKYNYGFALFSVYDLNTLSGFRIVNITQEIADKENIWITTKPVVGKIENVLRLINPDEVDIADLVSFIFTDPTVQTIHDGYIRAAKFFLNFKKARHFFHVINNRPSSLVNKKAMIEFLGISIEITFDLEVKQANKSHINNIQITSHQSDVVEASPVLTVEDIMGLFDEKCFIQYMRETLIPKK